MPSDAWPDQPVTGVEPITCACPYCGERIELMVDAGACPQNYIEDCAVCCRPIEVHAGIDGDANVAVTLRHENEA